MSRVLGDPSWCTSRMVSLGRTWPCDDDRRSTLWGPEPSSCSSGLHRFHPGASPTCQRLLSCWSWGHRGSSSWSLMAGCQSADPWRRWEESRSSGGRYGSMVRPAPAFVWQSRCSGSGGSSGSGASGEGKKVRCGVPAHKSKNRHPWPPLLRAFFPDPTIHCQGVMRSISISHEPIAMYPSGDPTHLAHGFRHLGSGPHDATVGRMRTSQGCCESSSPLPISRWTAFALGSGGITAHPYTQARVPERFFQTLHKRFTIGVAGSTEATLRDAWRGWFWNFSDSADSSHGDQERPNLTGGRKTSLAWRSAAIFPWQTSRGILLSLLGLFSLPLQKRKPLVGHPDSLQPSCSWRRGGLRLRQSGQRTTPGQERHISLGLDLAPAS